MSTVIKVSFSYTKLFPNGQSKAGQSYKLYCKKPLNFCPAQSNIRCTQIYVESWAQSLILVETSKTWFYKLAAARFSQINISKSKVLKISRILKKTQTKKTNFKNARKIRNKNGGNLKLLKILKKIL